MKTTFSHAVAALICATLLRAAPAVSQTCDAASLATFQIDAGVEYAEDIREGIVLADAYFKEVFGRTVCSRVTVLAFPGRLSGGVLADSGPEGLIRIGAGNPLWAQLSRPARIRVLIHEYFHQLQRQLSRYPIPGPTWLREGSAELVALRAVEWRGLSSVPEIRAIYVEWVRNAPALSLQSMETSRGFFDRPDFPGYALAVLAAEFLTWEQGPKSIVRFYEMAATLRWAEAFQKAFGKNITGFYRDFEEYREIVEYRNIM